jgi:hypothetical protein
MLSYDRVRVSLRGLECLDVILTEIPIKEDMQANFPPIHKRKIEEVKNGIFSPPDYQKLAYVPILLWYPPEPLP